MKPEAAGAREARGRLCHCPGDDPERPPLPRGPESVSLGGNQHTLGSKGAFGFQHPVRLYLPISKRQEYLKSSGEKVLASFPVQATIHFYNDDSESGSEAEQEEETQSNYLQGLEAEVRESAQDERAG